MATTETEGRQLVNAWVERDLVRRLEELAGAADRSRSAELRLAIREHVERDEFGGGSDLTVPARPRIHHSTEGVVP